MAGPLKNENFFCGFPRLTQIMEFTDEIDLRWTVCNALFCINQNITQPISNISLKKQPIQTYVFFYPDEDILEGPDDEKPTSPGVSGHYR